MNMEIGNILTIVASIVAIIGGVLGIVSAINKVIKGRKAILTASLEGSFPRNCIEITNIGNHIAKNLEVTISGCYAHECSIQDLYPGESIEVIVAIDKDTTIIDVNCLWKDGRIGKNRYHRTLLSR